MKTILAIIAIVLAVISLIITFVSWIRKRTAPGGSWPLREIYDDVFYLIGYLREHEPETYKKVSKRLDGVIDTLLEVEKILQEDETKDS